MTAGELIKILGKFPADIEIYEKIDVVLVPSCIDEESGETIPDTLLLTDRYLYEQDEEEEDYSWAS